MNLDVNILNSLSDLGLIVMSKKDLREYSLDLMSKTPVDKRFKTLTIKQACSKYNLSRHWFNTQFNDPSTLLKWDPGTTATAPIRIQEASLEKEIERLLV